MEAPGTSCASAIAFDSSLSLSAAVGGELPQPSYRDDLCPGSHFSGLYGPGEMGDGGVHWLRLTDIRPDEYLDLHACGFDSDLYVFEGSSCESLSLVACNGVICLTIWQSLRNSSSFCARLA